MVTHLRQFIFPVLLQSGLVSCAFYPHFQFFSLIGFSWFLVSIHSLRQNNKFGNIATYVSIFNFLIWMMSFHWIGFSINEYYSTSLLPSFLILGSIFLFLSFALYVPLVFLTNFLASHLHLKMAFPISFSVLNIALIIILPAPPFLLGYSFISPFFKGFYAASFIGVKGLTILFWILCFLFAEFIITKKGRYLLSGFIALGVLHLLGELALSSIQNSENRNNPLRIHLLQPNVTNELKRNDISGASKAFEIMGKNYELIVRVLQTERPQSLQEIFVLPETAIPYYFPSDTYYFETFRKYLSENRIALLSGGYWKTSSSHHNSAFFFNETEKFTEESVYHKQILLPFGEYLPGKDLFSGIKMPDLNIPDFQSGISQRIWHFADYHFTPFICYEVLFDSLWLNAGNVDFIYNPTNDAWFGPTIQQYQHLTLVWTKSLEFGIPVLRAANSGYSAWITPIAIRNQSPLLQESIQTFTVNSIFKKSFYANNYQFINLVEWLFLSLVFFVLFKKKSFK